MLDVVEQIAIVREVVGVAVYPIAQHWYTQCLSFQQGIIGRCEMQREQHESRTFNDLRILRLAQARMASDTGRMRNFPQLAILHTDQIVMDLRKQDGKALNDSSQLIVIAEIIAHHTNPGWRQRLRCEALLKPDPVRYQADPAWKLLLVEALLLTGQHYKMVDEFQIMFFNAKKYRALAVPIFFSLMERVNDLFPHYLQYVVVKKLRSSFRIDINHLTVTTGAQLSEHFGDYHV